MKKTRNIQTKNNVNFAGVDKARAARLGKASGWLKYAIPASALVIDAACASTMCEKALANANFLMVMAVTITIPAVMDLGPAAAAKRFNAAALQDDRRTARKERVIAVLLLVLAMAAYAAYAGLTFYTMKATEYAATVQQAIAQENARQLGNAVALQDMSWVNIGNLVMLFVPLLTSLLSFLVFAQADIRGDRARELEREREELEEEFELGEQYQIYQKEGLMKFDDDAYDLQQLQNAEQLYRNRAQQTLLNLRFELAREFGAEETEKILKAAGLEDKPLSAEAQAPADAALPEEEAEFPEQPTSKAVNFPQ